VASVAELAHGENCVLNHSLNQPAYLMSRELKLALWKTELKSKVDQHVEIKLHQNYFSMNWTALHTTEL